MPRNSKRAISNGNKKKKIIVFVILIFLVIFISGGVLAYKIITENNFCLEEYIEYLKGAEAV